MEKLKSSEVLFEHHYKNGNRLVVTENGFTLWDKKQARWIIDASVMSCDNKFLIMRTSELSRNSYHIVFQSKYKKTSRKKNERRSRSK